MHFGIRIMTVFTDMIAWIIYSKTFKTYYIINANDVFQKNEWFFLKRNVYDSRNIVASAVLIIVYI